MNAQTPPLHQSAEPARWSEFDRQTMPAPPENLEAEQAVLAAILARNDAFDRLSPIVAAGDFADPDHAAIFEAVSAAIQRGQNASAVTLRAVIADSPSLVAQGGAAAYLVRLQASGIGLSIALDCARLVAELAQRRRAMEIARRLYEDAADGQDPAPVAERVQAASLELGEIGIAAANAAGTAPPALSAVAQTVLDRAEEAMRRRAAGEFVGLPTGLASLDRWIGGLQGGELVIVGARTSMGKTALAEGFAWTAVKSGRHVQFYSFEMPAEQLLRRQAARELAIPSGRIRRGELSNAEFETMIPVMRELGALPMVIDSKSQRRPAPIIAQARQARRRGKLDLIVIDYLQLMHGEDRRRETRTLELSDITAALKALAMELDVPVVALSQVNREATSRESRRPQLNDLRDSGAIEQDADLVLLLHREHYYLAKEEPTQKAGETTERFRARQDAWLQQVGDAEGRGEIIVGKNRDNQTGILNVGWDGPGVRYFDLEPARDAREEELPY